MDNLQTLDLANDTFAKPMQENENSVIYQKMIIKAGVYRRKFSFIFDKEEDKFMYLNAKTFKEVIKNFKTKALDDDVMVVRDHIDSVDSTVGEVNDIYMKGGNLWAELEIKDEKTNDEIRRGLIKNVSVGYLHRYTDPRVLRGNIKAENKHKVIENAIYHVALTNVPYITKMPKFKASSTSKFEKTNAFVYDLSMSELSKNAELLADEQATESPDNNDVEETKTEDKPVEDKSTEDKPAEDESVDETKNTDESSKSTDEIETLKKNAARDKLEKCYLKLLHAGKMVPAQKDVFLRWADHYAVPGIVDLAIEQAENNAVLVELRKENGSTESEDANFQSSEKISGVSPEREKALKKEFGY